MVQHVPVPRSVSAARSREGILDAALELFAELGYDATTVDEVTERAGVSPRTFFRYFETKESVVFYRDFGLMRRFESALASQPDRASDYDAVCGALVELSHDFEELRERVQLYRRAVDSSPVLLGREQIHYREHASTIADAVAGRHGRADPDADDAALGALAVMLHERAFARWLDGRGRLDLGAEITSEFVRVRRVSAT